MRRSSRSLLRCKSDYQNTDVFDSFGKDKTFGGRLAVNPQTRFSIFSNRTPEFCLGMWVLS